jgi:hypothetical protein
MNNSIFEKVCFGPCIILLLHYDFKLLLNMPKIICVYKVILWSNFMDHINNLWLKPSNLKMKFFLSLKMRFIAY